MAAFSPLLGESLKAKADGELLETSAALAGKSVVGLYFASAACSDFSTKLAEAYSSSLAEKGLEVVFLSRDAEESAATATHAEMPWLAVPFGGASIQALADQHGVEECPALILLDEAGQVLTTDGVAKVTEDPSGEAFPWGEPAVPILTEQDILVKMGSMCPELGESGLKGVFVNGKNFVALGLVDVQEETEGVPYSGFNLKPYVILGRDAALDDERKKGFASDWNQYKKEITAFQGPEMLLIFDRERTYGEKLILTTTQDAFKREMARITERRKEIVEEFELSLVAAKSAKSGGGAGGAAGGNEGETADEDVEENVVVRDLPKDCKDWVSDSMHATHAEVQLFMVQNSRPPMQVMISRPRNHFGKACKFSDSGENLQNCRPYKDPNFALHRKELDTAIQAVRDVRTCSCQTTWFRPVNKSTQYSASDFLREAAGVHYDKVDELTEFLTAVSVTVEEALQTNETVDIFQEEFAHLGSEDAADVSKSSSNLRDIRTFTDVHFTKHKRVEWIEWVPNSTDMLVSSYCENLHFCEKLDNMGKAGSSSILIWSFQDSLAPHANLVAPWEVTIFKFYPTDHKYLIGGLASGQLCVWKLSDADLGYALREKHKEKTGTEEEKSTSAVPNIAHKVLSVIDDSHKKPIVAIEFLPATIELERRGRGPAIEKYPKDAPVKYFLTIAGDGQVMIWDFQTLLESLNDADLQWRPTHKVQLQRQDSGTEMGCCQLIYCLDRHDDKGGKLLTNFFASTEEGELIFCDWAAQAGEGCKPEFVKERFTVSKTFRPMVSLERSPFFPDILLSVTDWAFYLWKDDLWKDGIKEPLFQSSYTSTTFTRGVWSPTRPSVIFLGLASGGIDIWDFMDQSHKASLTAPVTSVPISSMAFLKHGDMMVDQKIAIGDAGGNTHVHVIPKNLVKQSGGKEQKHMRKFLDHEESRVRYFESRRRELASLKEHKEKHAQMAADEDKDEKAKVVVDQDKFDAAAEELYQKLQTECLEELGLIKPS